MLYYDPSWIQGTAMYGTLLEKGKIVFETPDYQFDVDNDIDDVMEEIRMWVSEPMYELLMQMLLPFSKGVQMDMAANLLDFLEDGRQRETGCRTADEALKCCYGWLQEEIALC